MMGRWGLNGMESFEQASVVRKEGSRLEQVNKSQLGESTP
jgi:hypothetical protein